MPDRRDGPSNADVYRVVQDNAEALRAVERRLSRIEGSLAVAAGLASLFASALLLHIRFA